MTCPLSSVLLSRSQHRRSGAARVERVGVARDRPGRSPADHLHAATSQHPARAQDRGGDAGLRPPASVLILTPDRLLAATVFDPPAEPTVSATPRASLLRLDLGTILLLGWLEWTWASDGQLERHQVYFNTVGEHLLWDLVTAVRRTIIDQSDLPARPGQPKDEAFEALPFKFANTVPNRLMLPVAPAADQACSAALLVEAINADRTVQPGADEVFDFKMVNTTG